MALNDRDPPVMRRDYRLELVCGKGQGKISDQEIWFDWYLRQFQHVKKFLIRSKSF